MFFIQACQGDQLDTGVRLKPVSHTETDANTMSYKVKLIPPGNTCILLTTKS